MKATEKTKNDERGNKMTEQDKNKMAEIIANLVLKNFAVHGDMKLAKEQAFNTIYKESPKVMWWFLNQY